MKPSGTFWRRHARARLEKLYDARARLRALNPSGYRPPPDLQRALVQIEGDIALLEAKLNIPYHPRNTT